jgi:sugar phosphate isomerase/epimerase
MLDAHGLKLISTFADYAKLRDKPDAVIDSAKALGVKYVVCGWIPHDKGHFNEKNARDAIAVFNKAGERLKNSGLQLAYHPHGFEFQPYQDGTLFDLMVAGTEASSVAFELDVFWAVHGGADPVKLLDKYGSRFELMHIKDLRKEAVGNLTHWERARCRRRGGRTRPGQLARSPEGGSTGRRAALFHRR